MILPENHAELLGFYRYFMEKFPEICRITFEFPMKVSKEIGKRTDNVLSKYFNCKCVSWEWFYNKIPDFTINEMNVICEQLNQLEKTNKVKTQGGIGLGKPVEQKPVQNTFADKICDYPFSTITILPNGKATFCTDFPDVDLGNIYESSPSDIWNGDPAQWFREYISQKKYLPICECCTHYHDKIQKEAEVWQ